ncbi:MAG: tape measure protein [Cutibacterium avidum]|nr:tape measure protein [Cutibacterium avidum]MDU5969233.1 tape measure protein [Cutibacterium avidum]
MATELAQGYLSLSVRFQSGAFKQLESAMASTQRASERTGRTIGRHLSAGSKSGASDVKANLNAAQSAFDRASRASQRAGEATEAAQRKATIATREVADATRKYGADSLQVLKAQDREARATKALSDAKLKEASVSEAASDAEKKLSAAKKASIGRTPKMLQPLRQSLTNFKKTLPNPFEAMPRMAQTSAGRAVQALNTRISSGMSRVNATVHKAAGLAGKVALAGAGATAGAAVAGVGFALKRGFGRLESLDNAKQKLLGLGNSAQDVEQIMSDATSSVKGTAFGMEEAATTSAMMVATGIKPGKQLAGVLRTVADTATQAGMSMGDAGQIFSSVAARGKLQGDDMMQLTSRGVPVLDALGEHLHKTQGEVSDLVSNGKIDFKTFADSMDEYVGGSAKRSGDTFTGALKNMGASLGRMGAHFLSGVFPRLAPTFQNITAAMKPLEDRAKKAGQAIGGVVGPAFDKLNKALEGGKGGVGQTLKRVTGGFVGLYDIIVKGNFSDRFAKAFNVNENAPIVGFLRDIHDKLKAIGETAGKTFGKIGDSLSKAKQTMSGVWSGLIGDKSVVPDKKDTKHPNTPAMLPTRGPAKLPMRQRTPMPPMLMPKVGEPVGLTKWQEAGVKLRHTLEDLRAKLGSQVSDMAQRLGELGSSAKTAFDGIKAVISPVISDVVKLAGPVALGALKLAWDGLKGAVSATSSVLSGVGEFLQRHSVPLQSIAVSVGTVVGAILAGRKALEVVDALGKSAIGAVKAFRAFKQVLSSLKATALAAKAFAAANPLGLIVISIAALAAGLVYAYKHSETFRRVVNGALNGVKKVGIAVANWFKGPFVNFFKAGFNGVKSAVMVTKNAVVKVFTAMKDGVMKVVHGLWNGIKSAFTAGKNAVMTVTNTLKSGVVRVWNAIKSTVTKVAHSIWNGVKTTFTNMKNGSVNIFNAMKNAIGKAWNGIKSVVGKPIHFVIDTVINKGILGAYNWVAGKVGAGKLDQVSMPKGLKSGGIVPGAFDPAHRDNVLGVTANGMPVARIEPGEMVVNRRATARHAALLHAINDGSLPRYAGGGIVGKAKVFFGNVADELGAVFSDVTGWLKKKIGDPIQKTLSAVGNNPATRIVAQVPKKLLDATANKLKSILSFDDGASIGNVAIPPGSGVGRWRPMVAAALRISGIGGGAADENLWLKQIVTESDGNPRLIQSSAVYDINIAHGDPARGLVQVPGVTWADFGRDMGPFIPNVYNPLKNLVVGMRAAARQHRSWRAVIGKGHGYLSGGVVPRNEIAALSEDGRPELVVGPQMRALNAGTKVFNADQTRNLLAGVAALRIVSGRLDLNMTDGQAYIYATAMDAIDDRTEDLTRMGAR